MICYTFLVKHYLYWSTCILALYLHLLWYTALAVCSVSDVLLTCNQPPDNKVTFVLCCLPVNKPFDNIFTVFCKEPNLHDRSFDLNEKKRRSEVTITRRSEVLSFIAFTTSLLCYRIFASSCYRNFAIVSLLIIQICPCDRTQYVQVLRTCKHPFVSLVSSSGIHAVGCSTLYESVAR